MKHDKGEFITRNNKLGESMKVNLNLLPHDSKADEFVWVVATVFDEFYPGCYEHVSLIVRMSVDNLVESMGNSDIAVIRHKIQKVLFKEPHAYIFQVLEANESKFD